jgi:type II pantothenate kinase
MFICGVDAGLTDTKYSYEKDGEFVFTNVQPIDAAFAYTGINAPGGDSTADSDKAAGGCNNVPETDTSNIFPEFDCVVAGARKLTGLSEFLLVSMGTGTAFLRVTADKYTHLGGSGLGGGTIKGLYALRGEDADVRDIAKLAERGNVNNVDLIMSDIMDVSPESLLPPDITVSLAFKLNEKSASEDFAAGACHIVAESLLMMAVFARRNDEQIVFTGGLSNLKILREKAKILERIHGISFIFPENAAYAGALGCQINYNHRLKGEL